MSKITFLGVGSPLASDYYMTSILINEDTLVDVPGGLVKRLFKCGKDPAAIDIILVTHFHGDHTLGIPLLLMNIRHRGRKGRPLHLVGPSGVDSYVNDLLAMSFPGLEQDIKSKCLLNCVPVSTPAYAKISVGGRALEAFRMVHGSEEAYGYRFAVRSKVVAVTGDTSLGDNLLSLLSAADVAIVDMTFESTTKWHLGADYVSTLPKTLPPGTRIFAVHRGEELQRKIQTIPGVILPQDGEEYDL